MIQTILYLTGVIHLVYCRSIKRDNNNCMDCCILKCYNNACAKVVVNLTDINQFNDISKTIYQLTGNETVR